LVGFNLVEQKRLEILVKAIGKVIFVDGTLLGSFSGNLLKFVCLKSS
jgi:hypothetical protein